jgi:hypothetical protein
VEKWSLYSGHVYRVLGDRKMNRIKKSWKNEILREVLETSKEEEKIFSEILEVAEELGYSIDDIIFHADEVGQKITLEKLINTAFKLVNDELSYDLEELLLVKPILA